MGMLLASAREGETQNNGQREYNVFHGQGYDAHNVHEVTANMAEIFILCRTVHHPMKPEATSPAAMNCSNCLHKLGSDDRFCSQCGQEVRTRDESISTFLKHFLSDYFTFDSKIMRSFGPLMFSPGVLTVEFIAGRRARYIPPLRMYIFVSIVFFLSLSLKGGGSGDLSAEDVFWNRFFEVHLPRLFFLLLPLFALLLHALNARMKNGGYVRHFVFALHFHSFIFVSALVYLGLSELMARFAWGAFNVWMGGLSCWQLP